MPLPLSCSETFDVVLKSDAAKTPAPTFVFRYLSLREWREAAWLYDDERTEKMKAVDLLDSIVKVLRVNLVGWRDLGVPFDPDGLDAVITIGEAWQLLGLSRRQHEVSASEKNAFASPSPTNTAPSAAAVGQDVA
ncbi:MAG TPA: hypothetical protein VFH53_07310 [Phycisphaerae bacterium]|nr:hypothetical protein [Phycisphaerae bacterium]